MRHLLDRREALTGLGALAAAGLWRPTAALASEPPPETTRLGSPGFPTICLAPPYVAEALLRAEGFTEIDYVTTTRQPGRQGRGRLRRPHGRLGRARIDKGEPITALGGLHVGCYELFAHAPIRTISESEGQAGGRAAVRRQRPSAARHHARPCRPRSHERYRVALRLSRGQRALLEGFVEGRIDAFLGFPPEPQELRERGIGRVILNTATDRPWSQYFCCIPFGNRISSRPIRSPPSAICGRC
jgi:NitT/TauT family transport system substrate-binding protein